MGIFGTKKEEKEVKTESAAVTEKKAEAKVHTPKAGARTASIADRNLAGVLIKARVSEKAYYATEKGVYVFEVKMDATKHDVRDAIKAKYNVTPAKINIAKRSPRTTMMRSKGRRATVRGLKKAYVYLKAGDKIELV